MNSSVLLFTLGLILISHSPLAVNADKDQNGNGNGRELISQICKNTALDTMNCMSIVKSDPRILNAKNFVELSKVILELALNKGIEGQNFLKGLLQTNNVPAIEECAHFHYDGVVGSFRSAMNELIDDPQTANYDAKVASDGPAACERGLASAHIDNPQIAALNRQITLLSNIAYLATNKLGS